MIELDNFQEPTREYKGNAILIAGPGAGKTRTISARMEYLNSIGVPFWKMKMLTFSRKAAHELLDRIPKLVYGTNTSTIHKFAYDLLKSRKYTLKVIGSSPDFTEKDERLDALRSFIIMNMPLVEVASKPQEVEQLAIDTLNAIDRYKSQYLPSKLPDSLVEAFKYYKEYLDKTGSIDFNDMLLLAINELDKESVYIPYVFLDEGHDTNTLQYELYRRIKCDCSWSVFDPHQMIYRWNGADEENLKRFRQDYQPKEFQLLNNWRSAPEIVEVLEKLYPRGLVPKGPSKGTVSVEQVDNYDQLKWAEEACKRLSPSSYLILGRTNAQLRQKPVRTWDFEAPRSQERVLDFSKSNGNNTSLMTIHKSKGLEADTVVLLGAGDSYVPFYRSHDLEEEKNLLYVACSRARKNLIMLYSFCFTPFFEEEK